MFEQITEITVQGGYFEDSVSLTLFKKRFNVLYGRNGSGKTSISRAIAEYKKPDEATKTYINRQNDKLKTVKSQGNCHRSTQI